MQIAVDGTVQGQAKCFTNEGASHKAFVANALGVGGIAAGSHTITLSVLGGTTTDGNDFFDLTVIELPFPLGFVFHFNPPIFVNLGNLPLAHI